MTERDLWELDQYRQFAEELQSLMEDVESAAPATTEAADSSGAIRMTIDRDSRPVAIQAVTDWKRRLDPGAVGAAVVEAYQACATRRTAKWSEALDNQSFRDRMARLEQLGEQTDGPPPPIPEGTLPAAFQPNVSGIDARTPDQIADDFLSTAAVGNAALDSYTAAPPAEVRVTGSTRRRTVTITLSEEALESCEVDADWARQQSGVRLTEALREALTAGRAALTAAVEAAGPPIPAATTTRLNEIFTETIAAGLKERRGR